MLEATIPPELEDVEIPADDTEPVKRGRGRPKGSGKGKTSVTTKKTPPTSMEWSPKIAHLMGYIAAGALWLMFRDIPDHAPQLDALLDKAAENYANEVAEPIARIFSRSALNRKNGRKLYDSEDALAIIISTAMFIRESRRLHSQIVKAMQEHQQQTPGAPPTQTRPHTEVVDNGDDGDIHIQVSPDAIGSQYFAS